MQSLSKDELIKEKSLAASPWQWDGQPVLTGCGAGELLDLELTAFFASRQCPGVAIRATMDWALERASAKRAVVSGFYSPLGQGRMAVVSGMATVGRLTQQLATQRNALVAQLAHKIVVAHASPVGSLAAQLDQWRLDGRHVELL